MRTGDGPEAPPQLAPPPGGPAPRSPDPARWQPARCGAQNTRNNGTPLHAGIIPAQEIAIILAITDSVL